MNILAGSDGMTVAEGRDLLFFARRRELVGCGDGTGELASENSETDADGRGTNDCATGADT